VVRYRCENVVYLQQQSKSNAKFYNLYASTIIPSEICCLLKQGIKGINPACLERSWKKFLIFRYGSYQMTADGLLFNLAHEGEAIRALYYIFYRLISPQKMTLFIVCRRSFSVDFIMILKNLKSCMTRYF